LTYDNFELAEHYAAAAYCPGNSLVSTEGAKLVCPTSKNCPKVEAASTSIVVGVKKYVTLSSKSMATMTDDPKVHL